MSFGSRSFPFCNNPLQCSLTEAPLLKRGLSCPSPQHVLLSDLPACFSQMSVPIRCFLVGFFECTYLVSAIYSVKRTIIFITIPNERQCLLLMVQKSRFIQILEKALSAKLQKDIIFLSILIPYSFSPHHTIQSKHTLTPYMDITGNTYTIF